MDIDSIELTYPICQSLFSNNLVETKSPTKKVHEKDNSLLDFLGENKKKIVFVVNNEKEKYVSNEEMAVLINLLTACKFSMADIALVNYYPSHDITYEKLTEQFKAKYILLFGLTCEQLGLPFNIPEFQVQKFQDEIYLFNPPFNDLINDKNSKIALWNCLKKIFHK